MFALAVPWISFFLVYLFELRSASDGGQLDEVDKRRIIHTRYVLSLFGSNTKSGNADHFGFMISGDTSPRFPLSEIVFKGTCHANPTGTLHCSGRPFSDLHGASRQGKGQDLTFSGWVSQVIQHGRVH